MQSRSLNKNIFIFLIIAQNFYIAHSAALVFEAAKTVASIFFASKVRKTAEQVGGILIIKGVRHLIQNNGSSSNDRNEINKNILDQAGRLSSSSYPDIEKTLNALQTTQGHLAPSFGISLGQRIGLIKSVQQSQNATPKLPEGIKLAVDSRDGYIVPQDLLLVPVYGPEDFALKLYALQRFKNQYQLTLEKDSALLKLDENGQFMTQSGKQSIAPEPSPLPPENPKKPNDENDKKDDFLKSAKRTNLNPDSHANKVVKNVPVEPGGPIKKFEWTGRMIKHMFSKDHVRRGILNLGKNKKQILNKIEKIILDVNKLKDSFVARSNEIRTIINGYEVTIRVFLDADGSIVNINAFCGNDGTRVIGKLIKV